MVDLLPDGEERFEELVEFMRHMHDSGDLDPLYPMLAWLEREMPEEQQLWLSFLYVAWYNIASGWAAFNMYPHPHEFLPRDLDPKWPTGTERRANRGGKVAEHIQDFLLKIASTGIVGWHHLGLKGEDRIEDWYVTNEKIKMLYMNGRWAGYKHCEVLQKVNDFDITAPDMGHANSSGPREGLGMLYDTSGMNGNDAEIIAELDAMGEDLTARLNDALPGYNLEVEDVETILCNWKSLMKGKYYVGHDIDENQEQILVAVERGILTEYQAGFLWRARKAVLPDAYRGELFGSWEGVDRKRMVAYRETGRVVVRT
jgi:hypothetical protein